MPVSLVMKGDRLQFSGLKCACGAVHQAPTQDLFIGMDMARKLPRAIKKRDLGQKAVLIADQSGYDAAGRTAMEALRKEGFEVTLAMISGPCADERALGEAMLMMRMDTEFFLGVGAEAVANTARAVAAQTERPYALLATQPDGCGYLSNQSRMTLRGNPITLPAVAPEVIAFDLGALMEAPLEVYAQGLADLAACHLARADWAAMKLLRGDDYCPMCADLAVEAAERAFSAIESIAARGEDGARRMAESLLMAGVAAFVSGGARPVSSDAQRLARSASAISGVPYAEALAGAVPALLDAFRSFDPHAAANAGGDPAASAALQARREGLRQVLERLPAGEAVASAIRMAAPEFQAAALPLTPPRAAGIASCEGLLDFATLAGCPLVP